MLITESRVEFIDEILHRTAGDLQITETQHGNAEDRYLAIGDVLSRPSSLVAAYNPRISPQGSLLLGTTLRPDGRREYDVDLICCLAIDHLLLSRPSQLLDWIEQTLRSHGTYETMLERKRFSRCVRVLYRDEFHLDIVPCCPDGLGAYGAIWVPDRNSEEWRPGNPKAYAAWFEARTRLSLLVEIMKAQIDPLPGYQPAERKLPLQRVVQLLKRWRDVAFRGEPQIAPSSIVITTLAGMHFQGQASVYYAMSQVLAGILGSLPMNGPLVVVNPIDSREILSESWQNNLPAYHAFVTSLRKLQQTWHGLQDTWSIDHVSHAIETMFDSDSPQLVLKAQAAAINRMKQTSQLGVRRSGQLTSLSTPGSILDRPGRHFGG